MRKVAVVLPLALVVQTHAKELATTHNSEAYESVLAGMLGSRQLNASSLYRVDLESTMLGKTSRLASPLQARTSPLLPHLGHPHHAAVHVRSSAPSSREDASEDVQRAGALSRRSVLQIAATGVATMPTSALAVENGLVTEVWSKFGGGPTDLFFPDEFLGTWVVFSKLAEVRVPQGEEMVKDMNVVTRAQGDVGKEQRYPLRFIRNTLGKVVFDRAYNTQKLVEATTGPNMIGGFEWDVDDPNILRANINDGKGGRSVYFKVVQRSEDTPAPDRIETSEVAQVVFDASKSAGVEQTPSVKEQRVFTKYKFRPIEAAGDGPVIVASQTVYDYLTSFDDKYIGSQGKPVTEYVYRMQMYPAAKFPEMDKS
eukprot:gnl/TRDRNA2_/TRDRNA2_189384_c0_seq1.p1 gnl/TRDRNA2_/TRDRNA2_189384_c0~~gnl/TRDRNA2_/TRDRNA2_189384_c0_seq1.p1  ORF type:complete len:369 (-),score=49.32 gnl/TRDRNA2_/TRDRNA2_189384_c0_seq1:138-1244(-)